MLAGGQPVANFSTIVCGELQGSATALQCPDIPCTLVYISTDAANAGNVYIGGSGVTKIDGTTDTTTGLQLKPGVIVPFFVTNLNLLYRIADNSGDDISYVAYR